MTDIVAKVRIPKALIWAAGISVLLLLIAVALVLATGQAGVWIEQLRALVDRVVLAMEGAPEWLYVMVVSFLPAIGFPASPIVALSGPAYGTAKGIMLSGIGLLINLTVCFGLAKLFRHGIIHLLGRMGYKLPEIPRHQHAQVTLLFRVIGMPLFVQNYLLGAAGVRFWLYLSISWPILMLQTAGFIILGDALMDGKVGLIVGTVALIVVLTIVFRFVRNALKSRQAASDPTRPGTDGAQRVEPDAGDTATS